MSLPVKFSYNGEIRRTNITTSQRILRYADLLQTAMKLFPNLDGLISSFVWKDEDGDRVYCSSDEELAEAVRVLGYSKPSTYRFEIVVTCLAEVATKVPCAEVHEKPKHARVRCDGCGVCPIIGIRYKCAVREDYDLCDTCEGSTLQPYPMLKIPTPDQAPIAITAVINDLDYPVNKPAFVAGGGKCRGRGASRANKGFKKQMNQVPDEDLDGFKGKVVPILEEYREALGQRGGIMKSFREAVRDVIKTAHDEGVKSEHTSRSEPALNVLDAEEGLQVSLTEAMDITSTGVQSPSNSVDSFEHVTVEDATDNDQVVFTEAIMAPVENISSSVPVQVEAHLDSVPKDKGRAIWAPVWRCELELLANMGFHDAETLVPLLRKHIKVPASMMKSNCEANAEGLQRVVLEILSSSMNF
jgi:hypothetical protein